MLNPSNQINYGKSRAFLKRPGKYAVMHKRETDTIDEAGKPQKGELAVGKELSFPSGDAYVVQSNGSVVRSTPKVSKKSRKAGKV